MDKSSFANRAAGLGRLELYLESYGKLLPKDSHDFTIGMSRYGECVFCYAKLASHTVYTYNHEVNASGFPIQTDSDTLCCVKCLQEIDQMEQDLPAEVIPNRDVPMNGELRIRQLLEDGELPRYWFQHNLIYPVAAKVRSWQCMFCDEPLTHKARNEITLAVDNSQYMTGGRIGICTPCLQIWTKLLPEAGYVTDSCCNCGTNYTITDSELNYRSHEKIMSKLLCPACAVPLVISTERVQMDDEGYRRYNITNCAHCNTDVSVDMMLDEPTRNKLYANDGDYACYWCMLEEADQKFYSANRVPFHSRSFENTMQLFYSAANGSVVVKTQHQKGAGHSVEAVKKEDFIDYLSWPETRKKKP